MDHLHMTHEEALKAAPVSSPGRQQFFMERCRQLIDEKKRRDETYRGTFHIETFGCQMNARDSEKLTGILEASGFTETDTEEADFVLYNNLYGQGQRQSARLRQTRLLKPHQTEESQYDDRSLRMYDAGGNRGGQD